MVKITKKTDYGLTFLTALSQKPDELHSLRSISDKFGLPYKFIGQVASILLEADIITSKEGASGGYKLSKKPEEINLHEVMQILDGPSVRVDCLRGKSCPRKGSCTHQYVLCALSETIHDSLKKQSLADLVKKS